MNVFVLGTGRCGSHTFAQACRYMTNYTVGHESRCSLLGPARLSYPEHHIEVDNRLSWLLGRLDEAYGPTSFYVHLMRDAEETARSLNRLWYEDVDISRAYADGILMSKARSLEVCRDLVNTVNANVRHFLRGKPLVMTLHVENAAAEFAEFWKRIAAQGDLAAAQREWGVRHNAITGSARARWNPFRKCGRILKYLPHFIRYA